MLCRSGTWGRCWPLLGLRARSFRTRCRLLRARLLNFALLWLRTLYLGLGPLGLLLRPLGLLKVALRFDRSLRRHVVVRLYRLRRAYVVVEAGPISPWLIWLIDSRAINLRTVHSWLIGLVEPRPIGTRLVDSGPISARLVYARAVLPRLIDTWAIDLWTVHSWLIGLVEPRPVRPRLIDSWAIHLWAVDSWPVASRPVESTGLVASGPDGGLRASGAGKGYLCRASVVFVEELLPVLRSLLVDLCLSRHCAHVAFTHRR